MSAVSARVCHDKFHEKSDRGGIGATESGITASRVATGVHALSSFPVTEAVYVNKMFERSSAAVLVS